MVKRLASLLPLLGLFLAPSLAQKVTITFTEAMVSGTQKPALEHLVQLFEKLHPNVTIKLIPEPNYGQLYTKTLAMVAAGDPPTLAQAYESWAERYAQAGAIVPLTSFIQGPHGLSQAQLDSLWPALREDMKLPDGQIWMMPFNKSDFVMYYNADWLARLKLPVPTTWAQFAQEALKVTSSQNHTWGVSIDPGTKSDPANGTFLFVSMLRAYGGHLIEHGKIAWDSKAGVEALSLLLNLYHKGALQLGKNYPGQQALGAERAPFDLSTVASLPYNLASVGGKFTMKIAALPRGPAGPGNVMQGTNLVLFAQATPAQKLAAWEFMKFLIQPAQTAYWAEQTGYLPVTRAAFPLMKAYLATHHYQEIAAESLAYARPTPAVSQGEEIMGILAQALERAFLSNVSPQQALSQAAQEAQSLLQ
jgi:multiple sugar transport system substrate-binding protein